MGHVYRVRHCQLAKQFALKVIAPAFAGDSKARERFNVEAQIASEISHPNIVSVVDFGEDAELGAYMVMELVEGEPLEFAEGSAPPSIRRALDVLAQVSDALDHIHRRGVIHGDIKAENLMMVEEPAASGARRRRIVRLLDFGLAKRLGTTDTELNGTPHYLAPERCSGSPATIASDIYALGVLGYLLVTRTMPFDGTVEQILEAHVREAPQTLSARRGEAVDEAIETLIMRAIAKQPALRHPSATAFRYELNNVMHMLEMSRRRSSNSLKLDRRADAAAQLFEQSMLAQVVLRSDDTIRFANTAFSLLVETPDQNLKRCKIGDTPLGLWVPDLARALARVRRKQHPIELRARRWSNELILWLTPAVNDDVHLLIQNHPIEREPVRASPKSTPPATGDKGGGGVPS